MINRNRSKRYRRLRIVIVVLASIILLASIALYIAIIHIFPYSIIRPHRISRIEISALCPEAETPQDLKLNASPFDFIAEGSIMLKGWFIRSKALNSKGTIIILHGIASCKEVMLGLAVKLSEKGFNCILYDSRAHGESGGEYCTFGYYEIRDLSRCLNQAGARFGDIGPFGIFGNSLGAAVAVQAAAQDWRIRCVVIESPFATLREIVFDYQKKISGLPFRFISNLALKEAGRIARFPVEATNPEDYAKSVTCPVLVIHGLKDSHIAAAYGIRVFRSLASPQKQWYPIAEGDHYNLGVIGGENYQKRIPEFFQSYLSRE